MSKWASRLKNQTSGGGGTYKTDKSPSVGSVGMPPGAYLENEPTSVGSVGTHSPSFGKNHFPPKDEVQAYELDFGQAGNDIPVANDHHVKSRAKNPGIPSDLFALAVRYCAEIHGDGQDAIEEMLLDLAEVPQSHHWWRRYFMQKLGLPDEVRCVDCQNCEDTTGNLGRCRMGIHGPGASILWWMTDQHPCIQYSAIQEAT